VQGSARPSQSGSLLAEVTLLASLGVIWGITFPVSHLGVSAGANPFWLFVVDAGVATGVMAVVAAVLGGPRPGLRSALLSAGSGALLIGGINLPLFWGEQFATGGAASIVYACSPAVSFGVLLFLRHHTPLRGLQAIGLALGIMGVSVLALGAGGHAAISNPWAMGAFGLGATCQGIGAVLVGRLKPHGEDRWGQTYQFAGAAAAGGVVAVALAPAGGLPASPAVIGSVAYFALASLVLGYSIFFELIRRAGAVTANLVTFLNPIVAVAVGVVAFGEAFQSVELIGLGIVLAALALLQPTLRLPTRHGPGPDATSSAPAHPAS